MVSQQQVQDYLEARRLAFSNPEVFAHARRELLACDETEVRALFEERFQGADDEERCQAITGFVLLYGSGATDTVLRWINDQSSTVRWVVCGCLHNYGDGRAVPALLDRMKHDNDCQVRGMAASALGQIGAVEALPHLHRAWQTDLEVDDLGHSPSSQAEDAMTSILRRWVTRQIEGTPSKTFQEATSTGQLLGAVTAEAIPFDPEGRINRTLRYAHVPMSAFGPGCASKLNLQTTLVAPFEVEMQYGDPTCAIQRILIYHRIEDSNDIDWAVDTIVDPSVMKASP